MAYWSAENATKAYLKTLKMGKRAKEPDTAEFISAMAAGNNAQLMVVACADAANSTTLGLVAAAHQTGGRVICILPGLEELNLSKQSLGHNGFHVEFIIGDAKILLPNDYKDSDFIVIDCNLENHEEILQELQVGEKCNNTIVLGYNAISKGSWRWTGLNAQLLPIGEGLLVAKIGLSTKNVGGYGKKRNWIVKVDKFTGEEHVFRVRSPQVRKVGTSVCEISFGC